MKYFLTFILLISTITSFAQPEKAVKEVVNGKKYYVHIVQSGNTLWGIHKLYDVPVEDIIKANPGTEKGLAEGQKLLIPIQMQTVLHVVENKETLFGIAKKYDVTVEQILAANPGVENGIKTGQTLKIPGVSRDQLTNKTVVVETTPVNGNNSATNPNQNNGSTSPKPESIKVTFKDTLIQHTVLDHETLYSISKRFMVPVEELQKVNDLKSTKIKPGDVLKIPVRKEKVDVVKIRQVEPIEKRKVDSTLLFPKKSAYKVAILLPFFLDKGENNSDYVSTLATEFYMGAKLALDSLEKLGLKAEVYVYDSMNDTNSLAKVLKKPEFKGMDLVIGPLFPDNADYVARWCKMNNARMICPVSVSPNVLKGNPFVYNAVPSDATLQRGLAQYTLKKNAADNIILIKSPSDKDAIMYESFRSAFMTLPVTGTRPKLIEATLENYASFMRKGVNNVLVYPTNEKINAVKFMNSVNNAASKVSGSTIYVYGTKEWINFDDVKPQFRNKYNFHFASNSDLNYKYDATERLHRKYRSAYNADMTKMAVQGFDVTFYFCSDLLMKKKPSNEIMNDFEMRQISTDSGFENINTFIIRHENYELINVNK